MKIDVDKPQYGDIASAVKAARSGDVDNLRAWLAAGGNPNQFDSDGWTPLLAAAVRGKSAAVDMLLNNPSHPADPDIRHPASGALAIHFAGHSGNVQVADKILGRATGAPGRSLADQRPHTAAPGSLLRSPGADPFCPGKGGEYRRHHPARLDCAGLGAAVPKPAADRALASV